MKHSSGRQSATSLPTSPEEEAHTRSTRYLLLMAVRVACFILMVLIQPYGWHTLVLGLGAVFIPYIAVVLANAGEADHTEHSVSPDRQLEATPEAPPAPDAPNVLRIQESPRPDTEERP